MSKRHCQLRLAAAICSAAIFTASCGSGAGQAGARVATSDSAAEVTTTALTTTTTAETTTTQGPLSLPLQRMAVIGHTELGKLEARVDPDDPDDVTAKLSPFSMNVGISAGDEREVDGSTWMRIGKAETRDVDAWVDSDYLIEIEGETDQLEALYRAASGVRDALSGPSLNAMFLVDFVYQPRVSLDGIFTDDDPFFPENEFNDGFADILWGYTDDGTEVRATVADFFAEFASSKALQQTERISINKRVKTSDTADNITEFFPEANFVELHYSGDADGTGWESILLVFERPSDWLVELAGDSEDVLVGIAVDFSR